MDQDDFRALLTVSRSEQGQPSEKKLNKRRQNHNGHGKGDDNEGKDDDDITTAFHPRQTSSKSKKEKKSSSEKKKNKSSEEHALEGEGYVDRAARRRAGLEDEKSEVEQFLLDRLENATTDKERRIIEEELAKIGVQVSGKGDHQDNNDVEDNGKESDDDLEAELDKVYASKAINNKNDEKAQSEDAVQQESSTIAVPKSREDIIAEPREQEMKSTNVTQEESKASTQEKNKVLIDAEFEQAKAMGKFRAVGDKSASVSSTSKKSKSKSKEGSEKTEKKKKKKKKVKESEDNAEIKKLVVEKMPDAPKKSDEVPAKMEGKQSEEITTDNSTSQQNLQPQPQALQSLPEQKKTLEPNNQTSPNNAQTKGDDNMSEDDDDDMDIFAGVGKYKADKSDSDDESEEEDGEEKTEKTKEKKRREPDDGEKAIDKETWKRMKLFEDTDSTPNGPDLTFLKSLAKKAIAERRQEKEEKDDDDEEEDDDENRDGEGREELPKRTKERLQGLHSSGPSIQELLAMDAAAEQDEKRKAKKEKYKSKNKGPMSKEDKLNQEWQKLQHKI